MPMGMPSVLQCRQKKWNNWKLYFCLAYSFYASHVFIHKYLSVPLNTDISNNNIVIKKRKLNYFIGNR